MFKPLFCHPTTIGQNIMPPVWLAAPWTEDASITCSSGLIECFVFASIGAVGGSCSGDPFKEDSTNQWDYMPLSVTCLDFRGRFSWRFSEPGFFFLRKLLWKIASALQAPKRHSMESGRFSIKKCFWEMVCWKIIQLMILASKACQSTHVENAGPPAVLFC